MPVLTSYSTANGDAFVSSYGGDGVAQSFRFTTAGQYVLTSIVVDMAKTGSPTGNVYFYLYATTGTYGTNSKPTGSPLAVSDGVSVSGLSTTKASRTVTFSGVNQYMMSPNTTYAFSMEYASGSGSSCPLIAADSSSPSYAGDFSYEDAGGWNSSIAGTYDIPFSVNGTLVPLNLVVADSTMQVSADDALVDLPGSSGAVIYGGWGSFFPGSSYAGSGSGFSAPELGAYGSTISISSDNVVLTQDTPLTVQDSTLGITSDAPAPIMDIAIVANDSTIGISSDEAIVDATVAVALPDNSVIGISSDSPSLQQQHHLTSTDASVATSSDSPTLTQKHYLVVNDSVIAVSADTPQFLQDYHLAVQDALLALGSDNARVLISFEPGAIDTGIYTPQSEGTPAPFPDAELAAVSEYTPQATTSATWSEGTDPDSGSWNSP